MAAVSPAGNVLYINQAAPLVSQHVANAQNIPQFQAALAAQMFAQKDQKKVFGITQTEQDHEIDDEDDSSPEFFEEHKKKKEHEQPEDEKHEENSEDAHLLDIKA